MLTHIVRDCHSKIPNRFELVVICAERSRQLLSGARATVDNPGKQRSPSVALREINEGKVLFDGERWKVDRPGMEDLFTEPTADDVVAAGLGGDDEEE